MGNLASARQQLRAERKEAQLQVEMLDQAISVIESLTGSGAVRQANQPTRIISQASRRKITEWKWDYNHVGPHSALRYMTRWNPQLRGRQASTLPEWGKGHLPATLPGEQKLEKVSLSAWPWWVEPSRFSCRIECETPTGAPVSPAHKTVNRRLSLNEGDSTNKEINGS
jgi:hypothetical protein